MSSYNFSAAFPNNPNDGDTVQWSAALSRWVAVAFPGGGGVVPLTTSLFVDPGTAVDPADQDGSIGAPFDSLQDAIDAANEGDSIAVCPGNAGDATWGDKSVFIFGFSPTGLTSGAQNSVDLGTLTIVDAVGASMLCLANLTVAAVDGSGADAVACASLFRCIVDGAISYPDVIEATEVRFGSTVDSTSLEAHQCNFSDAVTAVGIFTDCTFSGGEGTAVTGNGTFDRISAKNLQDAGWTITDVPVELEPLPYFGGGSDGSLAAGFGALSLTRDMYWTNVAFEAGDSISTNAYRIFVSGLLDLRGAPEGAIVFNGAVAGGDGSGQTAGAAGVTTVELAGTVGPGGGGSRPGGAGGAIGAAGTGGGSLVTSSVTYGGFGGTGAEGGAAVGAGGVGGGNGNQTVKQLPRFPTEVLGVFLRTAVSIAFGGGAGSGGGGGGGGAGVGGGGGGGAACGCQGAIYARVIARDETTDVAAIQGLGANGGNGANGSVGEGGGGGGGGASSGVSIYCLHNWLIGTSQTCVDVTGGTGGNGGDGTGGHDGGVGGAGAASGTLLLGNMIRCTWSYEGSNEGQGGDANVGSTGGAGGVGGDGAFAI